MHTPKYTMNMNNRHTTHGTSVSPLRSTPKASRFFSAEEVNKMLKSQFEPKLHFLMQELQDRQQIIAKLNNKLNQNDEKLLQQSSMIQSFAKKHKDPNQWQSLILGTVNQLLNDKTSQCWETITSQLKTLGSKMESELDMKHIEMIIQTEMARLKANVNEFMESHKKKSNSYWTKIKEALNKVYTKITAAQKNILEVNHKLEEFKQQRGKDREVIHQLQQSKHVFNNLIQLRKSVENIYSNYQAVLNMQKGFKQRIQDQGDSLWHQSQFMRTSTKIMAPHQDLIALQYSREENMGKSERELFDEWQHFSPMVPNQVTQKLSPNKVNVSESNKSGSELFPLQRTTPIKGQEHSQLFSLNNSNQVNSKIYNSTVLLNNSLETRKEMSQGVRQRLIELLQAKNIRIPLQVRYDEQIHYLKSVEGNYLFDMKGNMFKLTPNDLNKLQSEGLLTRNKSSKMSLSKVKKSNC